MKLLLIDNYDSFTFNLVQMFRVQEVDCIVKRSDRVTVTEAISLRPNYLVISPGPKSPSSSGNSIPLIQYFAGRIPILGVCLGLQCINEAFGGTTIHAPTPVHGKRSSIIHTKKELFQGIPSPCTVARYHSLAIDTTNTPLEVTARTQDGVIMAASHPEHKLYGVQFHPESFMTEWGEKMIQNFTHQEIMDRVDARETPPPALHY